MTDLDAGQLNALAGFLLTHEGMTSFELLRALKAHPVGAAFPQFQMLKTTGGANGNTPAETVAMLLRADDMDGVRIVSDCLAAWNALLAADPALAQPWRQLAWLTETVGGQQQEPPAMDDVARQMAALPAADYDRQRKGAAKGLGVRVTVLDAAVEHARKGGAEPLHGAQRSSPMPDTSSVIPLKLSDKGRPLAIVFNVIQVLENDPRWLGVFQFDEFAQKETLRRAPPFLDSSAPWSEREIRDADDVETAAWLQKHYDLHTTPRATFEAIQAVAARHRYHPVREYLDSLEWDGTPRIDEWLIDLFDCEPSEYCRAVSAKTLIAAVARIYQPGAQVDTVTILEGEQGIGKSSVWRVMASDRWFSDGTPDLHSKDAMQSLAGKWIIELAELSALGRSDVEAAKRFLSATQDHYRPSYGRHTSTVPRQCIFVGSTNADAYLKDATGNRRFWPISCPSPADLDTLRANRSQLWAEAVHRYKMGEPWRLDGAAQEAAVEAQESRVEQDEWEGPIREWVEAQPQGTYKVASRDILEFALGLPDKRDWTRPNSMRIAAIMRRLGWYARLVDIGGSVSRGYITDEALIHLRRRGNARGR